MLSIEAPANFVLILQSVPPFLVENILALALVVLLAVPFIAHVQLLLDNESKTTSMGTSTCRKSHCDQLREHANQTVVMHYPSPVKLDSSSNSDLNIQLTSMRTTCSTPTVKQSVDNLKKESTKNYQNDYLEEQYRQIIRKIFLEKQKTCLPLERSSSFLVTNAQLPIIDISAFDYDSYRHKLIEMSLKRQYGDRQAPGNVVLNSIHLNSVDSHSGIQLSEKYSHSLFDFIEEYYDAAQAMSKKEKEYLHPMDHFLVKRIEKPKTANAATETNESMMDLDQVPEMVAFRDVTFPLVTSLTPLDKCRALESVKHASKLTMRSYRSSSILKTASRTMPTTKPGVTGTRKSSVNPTTQQLFNQTKNFKSTQNVHSSALVVITDNLEERKRVFPIHKTSRSRTPRSALCATTSQSNKTSQSPNVPELICKKAFSVVQGKSSSESLTPGEIKPTEYSEVLSMDQDQRELVTCVSASSSEGGSSYSSSKRRVKCFVRSRASLLSSGSRTTKPPGGIQQWYVNGNANALFIQNYNSPKKWPREVTKTKLSVRPRSTGGRFAWDMPDVTKPTWCSETTKKETSTSVAVMDRARTAKTISNRRRTPEKGKLSETVLPILESVVDLQVNLICDGVHQDNIENEQVCEENVKRKPSSSLRKFNRSARLSDNKVSSESFVKLQARPVAVAVAVEQKTLSDKKSSDRPNPAGPAIVLTMSSSGIKTTAHRLRSASRLPVHMGVDKMTIKKCVVDRNREVVPEKRGKLFEKCLGLEKNSTSVFGKNRRTRTTGCFQSHTSSLSPKIELSLEAFQFNGGPAFIAGVSKTEPEILEQKPSLNDVMTDVNRIKTTNRSPNLSRKKITSVCHSTMNKIKKTSSPRPLKDNTDSLRKCGQQNVSLRRPFLRARSGRYGTPKLDVLHKEPTGLMKQKALYSSKQTVMDNVEEKKQELLKDPTEEEEPKAALVTRRELKTYIKNIQHILSNRDKSLQVKDLASLSITEAIIPELHILLSPREIQDLQRLLNHVKK